MPPSENSPQEANLASIPAPVSNHKKIWLLGAAAAAFLLAGAGGVYGYVSYMQARQNSASLEKRGEAWSTSTIAAQLPGAPAFTVSYPAHFGEPQVSASIGTQSTIDPDNNVEKIDFYKPSLGSDETGRFLGGFFLIAQLEPGQTLADYANAQLLPTATDKLQYDLTVDGRPAIAQKVTPSSPMTLYYIEFKEGLVLNLTFTQNRYEVDPEEGRALQDKIVKTIKFTNQVQSPVLSPEQAAVRLKEDITLLQGTSVSVSKSEGKYYLFHSSDGNGGIVGIAKLEDDSHFALLWTGQEAPNCSTFPQEIPLTLMDTCYQGNDLRSR